MNWKFVDNRPIYAQIVEEVQRRIISGFYPSGASMPSVRQLAEEANVNPNTMQKAMAELEAQGLIHTQRTSGRTVSTDEELKMQLKTQIAGGYINQYFEGMRSLGIERDTAVKMLMEREDGTIAKAATATATVAPEAATATATVAPEAATAAATAAPEATTATATAATAAPDTQANTKKEVS